MYTADQIRKVLIAIGQTIHSEVDADFIVFCPFHNNYRSPAAEVSKETGTLYCFSCHVVKKLPEIVMKVDGKTFYEAQRLIESMAEDVDIFNVVDSMLSKPPAEFEPFDSDLVDRLHADAMTSARAVSYFAGRGITVDSMSTYRLGYSAKQDMVTVPVWSHTNVLVGFVGRSVEGKEFKNSSGLPKKKTFFNIQKCRSHDRIYVVESSFDAIRIEQLGHHAVACLGSVITKDQLALLDRLFNNVICIPDNDDAGRDMAVKMVKLMGTRCAVVNLPEDVKDVGDMEDANLADFLARANDPLVALERK